MFKNRGPDGKMNLCGEKIAALRRENGHSQREFADFLQEVDLSLNKNAIQLIECGERFVTDVELKGFARYFGKTADYFLND